MIWQDPHYFWLLLLLPLLVGIQAWRLYQKKSPVLLFGTLSEIRGLPTGGRVLGLWFVPPLYWICYLLVILALARPQYEHTTREQSVEGIDIILSIDTSTSMLAEDFKPNRLLASKRLAGEFIRNRTHDRVGLNVFARQSFTVCPPTTDQQLTLQLLEEIDVGMVQDGTAIGLGIATAINRLRESEAESRVIILMTDGLNNAGEIDPVTAGELAAEHGIRIYTMGVGSRGTAPYPINDPVFGTRYQNVEVNIDEEMLSQIAEMTGGRYYRAEDTEEMESIYAEIDELERSEIHEVIYTDREDLYPRFLIPALLIGFLALSAERILLRPSIE